MLLFLVSIPALGQELNDVTARAIKYGHLWRLDKFIHSENLNECVYVGNSKKYNYVALSIKLNSMSSLKYFVKKGADIEGVCANKTPLMYAAQYGHLNMVKYLLDQGAQINRSIHGLTASDYARQFNNHAIRKYLRTYKMQ